MTLGIWLEVLTFFRMEETVIIIQKIFIENAGFKINFRFIHIRREW